MLHEELYRFDGVPVEVFREGLREGTLAGEVHLGGSIRGCNKGKSSPYSREHAPTRCADRTSSCNRKGNEGSADHRDHTQSDRKAYSITGLAYELELSEGHLRVNSNR